MLVASDESRNLAALPCEIPKHLSRHKSLVHEMIEGADHAAGKSYNVLDELQLGLRGLELWRCAGELHCCFEVEE